jgi:soluble lytic murein transglycosylase-like protein
MLRRISASNGGSAYRTAALSVSSGTPRAVASAEVDRLIEQAAAQAGVDPDLVRAVAAVESGYRNEAVSSAGAKGLMQLMDGTARQLGVTDSFDPEQNLLGGATYLRFLLDKFGDEKLALAAYNAGPGAVQRYGGIPPYSETRDYVRLVTGERERLRSWKG